MDRIRICFVCLGNICRSPTADGVMHKLVADAGLSGSIEIDSAGTGAYHVGERADGRSRATASARGVPLHSISRQFLASDFADFDYVLAMDQANLRDLHVLAASAEAPDRLHLFRSFDPESPQGADVPDPYYGGERGFDDVFDICEAACRGLLEHLVSEYRLA